MAIETMRTTRTRRELDMGAILSVTGVDVESAGPMCSSQGRRMDTPCGNADSYIIPTACDRATADFIISSPLMDESYDRLVPNYDMYLGRPVPGMETVPALRPATVSDTKKRRLSGAHPEHEKS
jgi:hypothetical protein